MSLSVEQTVNHFDRPIQTVADIIVRSPSLHSNLKQSTSFILSRKNIKPVLPSSLFVHEFYRNNIINVLSKFFTMASGPSRNGTLHA